MLLRTESITLSTANKFSSHLANITPPAVADNSRPFLAWQRISDWAAEHYRARTFNKDEKIPARPGLLYLVQKGTVRLLGNAQVSATLRKKKRTRRPLVAAEEAFLGFVGAGQPFEVVAQPPFVVQSFAHVDQTTVIWLYWNDLDTWPHFQKEVLDAFRRQHQRKLLWLSVLGQRRTIDRLLGFLTLLIDEHGELFDLGYYLPFPLTHTQIGSAIGSTRVTVTRLMGRLRSGGMIGTYKDNLIYIPNSSEWQEADEESISLPTLSKPWKPIPPSIDVKAIQISDNTPDIGELFETDISFPEEMIVGEIQYLEISLLSKLTDPRGARMYIAVQENTKIPVGEMGCFEVFIHVTANDLLVENPVQVLRFNPSIEHPQTLKFKILAEQLGDHVFEVEFFFDAERIGYVLVETLVA